MRFAGRIASWNAERGFGFLTPDAGGHDVFVHLSAIPTRLRPPAVGQPFTFEVTLDARGRKRAANVGVPTPLRAGRGAPRRRHEPPARWSVARVLAVPLFLALAAAVALAAPRPVSPALVAAYVAMSGLCFVAYALDKRAARAGGWRVSETTLLALGLVGGWPGGLLAQQWLRHKTSKPSFRRSFWLTVLANAGAFVAWHALRPPAWPAG